MMEADLTSRVFEETMSAYESSNIEIIVNVGGTRSGKTYSVLQLLALIAQGSRDSKIISVVTQTFPQLRQGAMRDFEQVLRELPIRYDENKSTHTWDIGCSKVEFFSADQYEKVLGAQRDILFVNECNRLGYEVVRQLMVRTAGKKFFDFNPVASFWLNEHILTREGVAVIHSTYKDNAHLSASQVAEIESYRNDTNWWRVYGLGLEGRLEGLVFPDFEQVDEPLGRLLGYGVDFGFSNDQTAVVALYADGNAICFDEVVYATGLITADLSGLLKDAGLRLRHDVLVCDSARPESIEELYRYGWNARPCTKGRDSVIAGINAMKRHDIKVTKRSVNLIKELRNHTWECDKEGNPTNKPVDKFNHAIDAARYIVMDRMRPVTFANGTRLVGVHLGR